MEAPDKICIHTRTEPYCSITWSEVKEKNCTNEEYLRKDALLEWLNEELQNGGPTTLVQHIINKLNSM